MRFLLVVGALFLFVALVARWATKDGVAQRRRAGESGRAADGAGWQYDLRALATQKEQPKPVGELIEDWEALFHRFGRTTQAEQDKAWTDEMHWRRAQSHEGDLTAPTYLPTPGKIRPVKPR